MWCKDVQNVSTSCGKVDMSLKLWKHALGVSMVKIPNQNEENFRVGRLLFTDVLVEFVQCLTCVVGGAGRDLCGCQQKSSKLPRQVEWLALNNQQLPHCLPLFCFLMFYPWSLHLITFLKRTVLLPSALILISNTCRDKIKAVPLS